MLFTSLFLILFASRVQAVPNPLADPLDKQSAQATAFLEGDFIDPKRGCGSLLTHDSGGLGEPINIIISGKSSKRVLEDDGFIQFAKAIGFGKECLGAHHGAPQTANLGDGNGWVNQRMELRDNYGISGIGTCLESLVGGNHFRSWSQNGPWAHTNALFLAVSEEKNIFKGHCIIKNGYDVGRDKFVKRALQLKEYRGVKYNIVARNITGLIPPGSTGVNHGIPTDGHIVLLEIAMFY